MVFELRIDNSCTEAKLKQFMEAVLHQDNFARSVSQIWTANGQPPMSLVSNYGPPNAESRLKRVRIIP